jgi:hypothetical protein
MKSKLVLAGSLMAMLFAGVTASVPTKAVTVVRNGDDQSNTQTGGTTRSNKKSKAKKVSRDVGTGTEDTVKDVGNGGEKATKGVAKGSEVAVRDTTGGIKDASKGTVKGTKKAGKATAKGTKKVGKIFK